MFRARLRARLCRGKEGLHRAPTFVRQFGGYTHHLLLFLSSTHNCPLFHPLLYEIYPLVTTLRPSKGGLKRQSLLQTWCGSAPAADHPQMVTTPGVWILRTRAQDPCSCCCRPGVGLRLAADYPQMVTTPGVWILRTRAQDSCSCCLIFRTKVDEKVDNSGWRIKIVADGGYTHQIVGQRWVPGGALLPRGRVWPVDVPETSCKSMPTL